MSVITRGRKTEYKGLNQHKQYKDNPFIGGDSIVPIKRKNTVIGSRDHILLNDKTGEVGGTVAIKRVQEVDAEVFIKIYISQIKDLFTLKPNAMKVLSYIFTITPPNKDRILFDMDECKTYTGYTSDSSIFDGLSILIENEIIARSEKSYFYYINPGLFFNGDRLILVNEYRKKKNPMNTNQLKLNYNEQQPSEENTD